MELRFEGEKLKILYNFFVLEKLYVNCFEEQFFLIIAWIVNGK
jgi:hypothetical protein